MVTLIAPEPALRGETREIDRTRVEDIVNQARAGNTEAQRLFGKLAPAITHEYAGQSYLRFPEHWNYQAIRETLAQYNEEEGKEFYRCISPLER